MTLGYIGKRSSLTDPTPSNMAHFAANREREIFCVTRNLGLWGFYALEMGFQDGDLCLSRIGRRGPEGTIHGTARRV
jgi:hypothetical protein